MSNQVAKCPIGRRNDHSGSDKTRKNCTVSIQLAILSPFAKSAGKLCCVICKEEFRVNFIFIAPLLSVARIY